MRQQGTAPIPQYEHESIAPIDNSPQENTPVRTLKNHYTPVHAKPNHGRSIPLSVPSNGGRDCSQLIEFVQKDIESVSVYIPDVSSRPRYEGSCWIDDFIMHWYTDNKHFYGNRARNKWTRGSQDTELEPVEAEIRHNLCEMKV